MTNQTPLRIRLQSVTFVGCTPVFTGTDQTGRQHTFVSTVNYTVKQARSLLDQTLTFH